MEHSYSFEKLDVWQKAREYVVFIYRITNKFPDNEKFGITSQIRRAAISIISNIAEGSSRSSLKEQIRYTEIAYGSALETFCQLLSSMDLGFLSIDEFQSGNEKLKEITNKLNALKNSQVKRLNEQINNSPNNQINKSTIL
jgi:four helix bundle protein